MRRKELALGIVLSISVGFLSSCGGGGAAAPPAAAPAVTLSAPSLTFTGQLVGTTSSSQSVTLTNSGNAGLSITSIAISGTNSTEFSQSNTCGTSVAAGANCTINVSFTPAATGSRTASVTITDNASGSPQSISLTGTGTAPSAAVSPTTVSFSNQLVGTTSSAMTATLSNSGTAALTVTGLAISGANSADFAQSNTCGTSVATGANCTISVTFTPSVNGAESATLTVTDNSGATAGSTQTVALSGTGTEPVAALSPATLSFPSELVGTTSSAMTATVSNSGTAPLTITSIIISGTNSADFANQSSSTCSASSPVAVGGSCNINIAFTPTVSGAESATLTVTDNSGAKAGSTQAVALSGTGTASFPTVSGSVTKGAVSGGTVAAYAINSDGSSGTLLSSGTDMTDANGNFSVTLTAVPSGPVRVSVMGGTYPSEWDNSTVTSSSAVSAIIDSVGTGFSGLSVTAVSTFVDSNASGSLKSGTATSITSAHAAAEALIVGYYGFSATVTVETLAPSFTSSSIGTDGFKLGLVVGTLTEEGASLNSSDPDSLITAMALDISDGIWNGLVFGKTITLGTSSTNLPTTAGTSDFSSSLGTYVGTGYSPTSNGITTSNASSTITSIDAGVATCTCTPPAVGLAATSSGAINSMAFTPSNTTTSHQFVFIAARSSGVVAVDITDPTVTSPPVKVWQQFYVNQPGSGGFGEIDVGGVIPFVGTAGHPQLFALAYGSKHILILNANTLVTGTPWVDNPVDAEMDVPIVATSEVEFSGGAAYIGSGLPLGGSLLALATADGYMIFDASQVGVAGGNPVVTVYPVQDPTEIIAENLGGDPVHHYLLGGNESTCEGFGCPGGVQLVDLSAGVTNGTSYYITPANFPTVFPGTPTSNSVDASSVDPSLQVGILTFEDTGDTELVNMSGITETVSTTPGVLNSWAPAAGGVAHVVFGTSTPPVISGSAVDATTHLAYFMAGYSTDMVVGQIQNPASVPAGGTWQGLSDWSFYSIPSSPSLSSYTYATDPHADGVVYNLLKGTPYGYELDGSNLGVVQTDLAGFLAIPRAGTSGDPAHQPGTDPTTVTNTSTGGKVMQEITWVLPLGITSTSLPTGIVGSAYSATLSATNGTSPYTWSTNSAGSSTLSAAGLTLSSTGTISGTPTTVGTFTFTLTVTDSSTPAQTASVSVTIYIDATPPSISTTSLPAATLGSAYSGTVSATGGQTPYTWSITAGALPTGLTLNASTGVISGTPTVAGVANFTVTVTDSSPVPQTNSASLSITVNNTTPLSVPATITLPAGSIYSGYSDNGSLTGSFTGGTPPFACTITSGTLPAGLSQSTNNSCAIQGVPTATGTATVAMSVTDSNSISQGTGTTNATVTINPATNNAELNGQYAFVMNGYDAGGLAFVLGGSFTADGAGNITAGSVDVNDSSSTPVSLTFTGNYGVGPDNRGGMVITASDSSVHTILFSLGALSSGVSTKAHVELFDSTDGSASGDMMLQDTTAFSTSALTSTYTFGVVGGYDGRLAAGGVFTANGSGVLGSGEADIDNDGTIFSATSFTGTYGVGTTNGRGTGSFTLTLPTGTATVNFAFYVVSATRLYLVSTDPASSSILGSVFGGEAQGQTGGPYLNSSLNGVSVFSDASLSSTTTGSGLPGSDVQAGLLALDGSGGFRLTSDEDNAGTVKTNTITGFYSVAANGRVALTVTSGASTSSYPPVIYLQAPGEGFIIGTDPKVAFGSFAPQSAGPFTAASFSGNYFFGTNFGQSASPGSEMQSGVEIANGSCSLSGTSDSTQLPSAGTISLNPGEAFSGTCSVSPNGRVTFTSSGGGTSYFYIADPTKVVGIPDTSQTNQAPTTVAVEQ